MAILSQGRNCWRIARADRAAFIVDGEDYFKALYQSLTQARHSILIVGWDIHSELRLIRNGEDDASPNTLRPLLDHLAERRPDLDVYISSWDFAMIYAMEREFFPQYSLRWKSHDRVHFCLDGEHPIGASQHQKVVVVDDRVAFSGGFDLSKWRWDTSEHRIDDPRRVDPSGHGYAPFHDVQMVVAGEAAGALGELARERWFFASGARPKEARPDLDSDPWPASIRPTLTDIRIGIARTLPSHAGREEVREVENLYLDSIRAAERFIYIENQYLSSHRVGQALAERLREPGGPEVVIVTPEKTGGWLEQHTMDVLRARVLRELRNAGHDDRLRVYVARLSEEPAVALFIHAKVMIVDDVFARVASSNLSNRSMGLDSECDLAVESTPTQECRDAIRSFRHRLLSEHLGLQPEELVEAEREHRSLIAAIESLRNAERSLEPLSAELPPELDEWVPDAALLDPERPMEPNDLLKYFVSPEQRRPLGRNLLRVALLLFVVLALAAAWRWTPLGEWIRVDAVANVGKWLDAQPFTPLLVLATFIIFGTGGVPITLMIVASVMVFGPWLGGAYALVGSELSALASFGLGHVMGRDVVSRLAGVRVNRISRKLAERGVLTTVTVRIVPVAPFAVVNVIAGVSDIRLRDFALGTAIGMLPGVIVVAALTDGIAAALRDPSAGTLVTVLIVAGVLIGALFALRHWLRSRSS